MPIEIKELVIRAFVTDTKTQSKSRKEKPKEKQVNNLYDSLAVVTNMLKQEKER
jgi:uncharacterized protein DUF5908